MSYMDNLNTNQKKAVMHVDGPCLVLAGAGSGKTKVLTTRIAHLVDKGINSSNILAITFTNKASKEMKERLNKMLEHNYAFVGTFHSFGVRIIRENYEALGLDRNFTILDSDDVLMVIKRIMKEKLIDIKEIAPTYVRNRISYIKNEMLSAGELNSLFNTAVERQVLDIYYEYCNILKKNNSVDFDDLLLLPVKLFKENKLILDKYQDKYKYILIDEYQDTNEVQYKMSKLLADKYNNIFVVGDPNQSIYKFRGANFRNILNFEKDYKGVEVVALSENYRSTNNILKIANSVIKNNIERKDNPLFSSKGEGVKSKYLRAYDAKHEITLITSEIKKLLNDGYDYSDIGILYRTNTMSRLAEECLISSNIPYKIVGSFYFYNRKEIKDLLSYLKLILNNNDDISLRRVINVPKRGIGATSVSKLGDKAKDMDLSMFDAIDSGKELDFKNMINSIIDESDSVSLTELIDLILNKSGMLTELKNENTMEADLRIEYLMEFKSITAAFEERTGSGSLADFLEEVSLIADMSEHKDFDDVVTLMTVHSAKGLEFKVVFLIGMEEGIFPHSNSFLEKDGLEEERRLCYVGVTRAMELLYITNAKRRITFGKESINPPSRFISEMDSELIDVVNNNMHEQPKIDKSKMYNESTGEFNKGSVIMHTIYGRGVVTAVEGDMITVAFSKNFGVRKLLKNHKNISLI